MQQRSLARSADSPSLLIHDASVSVVSLAQGQNPKLGNWLGKLSGIKPDARLSALVHSLQILPPGFADT